MFCQAFQEQMQNSCTVVGFTEADIKALDAFMKQEWCLVILDIHPFDENRTGMLRMMRSIKRTPILTLIPPLEKGEKIALFHAGADVCLDKTTDIEICAAQAETLIQSYLEANAEKETRGIIAYGTELLINSRYRQVIADGEPLALTRKEFDLLYCLASYPGQVFSLEHLYAHVWNDESAIAVDEIVKSQIKSLRKKLASVGKNCIQNEWGVGYKFVLAD